MRCTMEWCSGSAKAFWRGLSCVCSNGWNVNGCTPRRIHIAGAGRGDAKNFVGGWYVLYIQPLPLLADQWLLRMHVFCVNAADNNSHGCWVISSCSTYSVFPCTVYSDVESYALIDCDSPRYSWAHEKWNWKGHHWYGRNLLFFSLFSLCLFPSVYFPLFSFEIDCRFSLCCSWIGLQMGRSSRPKKQALRLGRSENSAIGGPINVPAYAFGEWNDHTPLRFHISHSVLNGCCLCMSVHLINPRLTFSAWSPEVCTHSIHATLFCLIALIALTVDLCRSHVHRLGAQLH